MKRNKKKTDVEAKLKEKISYLKESHDYIDTEYNRLLDEKNKLQRKLDIAMTRLVDIAAGLHYADEVDKLHSNVVKLQTTAAVALKKIASV